jgi:hypothetical protein
MITEIRKKLAKELSLVIAERAREESVNVLNVVSSTPHHEGDRYI